MRPPKQRLRDSLEAMGAKKRHLGGATAAFEQDGLPQGGFARKLRMTAEAARALPDRGGIQKLFRGESFEE